MQEGQLRRSSWGSSQNQETGTRWGLTGVGSQSLKHSRILSGLLCFSLGNGSFFSVPAPSSCHPFSSSHTFCFSHLERDGLVSFPRSWERTLIWCILSQCRHRSTAARVVVMLHRHGSSCVTGLIRWEVPEEVLRGRAGNSRKSQDT